MRSFFTPGFANRTIDAPAAPRPSTVVFARRLMSALTRVGLAAVACLLPAGSAPAVDREWNQASGVQVFNTGTNWTPNGTPVAGDNLTFPLNGDVDIFLGAPSVGNNITFSDGIVEFLDVGNSMLNNGGAVKIDDPTAINLADGAFVTLNGATISWTSVGDATIGNAGTGTLTVNNGGDFRADQIFVGDGATGRGEVTVTGTGSTLTASLNSNVSLYAIGINGGTGTLHVLAGADITTTSTTTGDISVGEGAGSVGTLNIDGAGSTAESEDVNIGYGGSGSLNITNGGSIVLTDAAVTNRNFTVGLTLQPSGAIGNGSVFVSGDNSLLSVGTFNLGNTGSGSANVLGGGRIAAGADSVIGDIAGGTGSLFVSGAGSLAASTFAVTGNLFVGNFGRGIADAFAGGRITVTGSLFIGDEATNTSDNSVLIDDSGSQLIVGSALYVGNAAVGNNTPGSETTNRLEIIDGATASAVFLRVGEVAGSKGEMLVDSSSSFSSTTDAVIGTRGTGSLEVSGGAIVSNTGAFYVGFAGGGNGSVLVTGSNSVLQANGIASSLPLVIGGNGGQSGGIGTVTVSNGGTLNTTEAVFLGGNAAGDGTLLVTGFNSRLDSDDGGANEFTYIGYANRGTFTIANGGSADSELVRIGELASVAAGEASATVTGVNIDPSTWNISGSLIAGNSGVGRLDVTSGGVVNVSTGTNANLSIGEGAASDGSSLTVSGGGSQLNHLGTGRLSVGNLGGSVANPAVLTVSAGGHVSTANFYIADAAGSVANALVDGANSRIDATAEVTIGDQGTGSATIQAGGVIASQNTVRVGGIQSGVGTATVTGAGSQLVAGTTLSVADIDNDGGAAFATGTLNIASGGTAQSTGHTFIGRQGQNQGTINVNSGGVLLSLASLYVGGSDTGAGGTGTLNINSGGSVSVTNELVIYNGDTVNLNASGVSGLNLKTLTRNAGSQFNFTSGRLFFFNNDTNNRILNTAALTDIFNADHTITTGKTLQIGGPVTLSAPLRLNGGTFALESVKPGNEAAFAANLDWDSGTLQFNGSGLTVGNTGLFGPTLLVDTDQTLLVGQSLNIDAGAEMVVAGSLSSAGLTNNGDLVAVGATINGPVVNNTAVTVVGTVDFNGLVSGPGDFFGPGTANFNGGMVPGASPAEIGFEGNVALADTNTLFIEIAGTTPGSQYDRLVVAGDAALDGILDVSLVGFSPTLGQQFTVLTAGSIVDNGLALGGPAAGSFSLLVGSSSVILQAIAAGLPGDYNQNGTVDAADYVVWRKNEGTTNPLPNDPIGGTVGPAQYNQWRAHFGQSGGSGSAQVMPLAVPEPSALLTALIFAINLPSFWGIIARRRRLSH